MLEAHLHVDAELQGEVDEFHRPARAVGPDEQDRRPEGVLRVDLRQDLVGTLVAQVGPAEHQRQLLLERAD